MVTLKFSPEADSYLTELESDSRSRGCVARINTALDLLEEDPGAAWNRRRRFQSVDLWGIPVRCDDDLLVLWGFHAHEADTVIVHYIGPSP